MQISAKLDSYHALLLTMLYSRPRRRDQVRSPVRLQERIAALVHGSPDSIRHFLEYSSALKEEGDHWYRQGDRFIPTFFYVRASDAVSHAERLASRLGLDHCDPEMNALRFLRSEICNSHASTLNQCNDWNRRMGNSVRPKAYPLLCSPVVQTSHVLQWLGSSDEQREKVHFQRGAAFSLLADFLSCPENRCSAGHAIGSQLPSVRTVLQMARDEFYSAWKINDNDTAKQSFSSIMKDHGLVPANTAIQTIFISATLTWRGIHQAEPSPPVSKSEDLRTWLPKVQTRDCCILSRAGILAAVVACGLEDDRADGLRRLLGVTSNLPQSF